MNATVFLLILFGEFSALAILYFMKYKGVLN